MEKTKKKWKTTIKIVVITFISLILLAGVLLLIEAFCWRIIPPSNYTLEEHCARISKQIEKRYITSGQYEEYTLYPVYNQNEDLTHFIVEFDSNDFVIVKLVDVRRDAFNIFANSMYEEYRGYLQYSWRRYRVSESDTIAPEPFEGHSWQRDESNRQPGQYYDPIKYYKYYETDENGDFIKYTQSPFRIAGVENSKLYFFNVGDVVDIPAIRDGDYFLNLISMEKFHKDKYEGAEYSKENISSKWYDAIPHLGMSFNPQFALGV